ncbi:MAG: hypothetical protein RIQ52_1019 [Pseudomonadota bacterium]
MISNCKRMTAPCVPVLLGSIALYILAKTAGIEVIDGVTAATRISGPGSTATATPKFSISVMQGPAIASGARLLEGQRLQMNIAITNPWSNNTVTMDVNPKPVGLTLTSTGTNASPRWLLDWTPSGIKSNYSQNLTFTATFKSSGTLNTSQMSLTTLAGANNTYQTSLSIPLGPHQPPVLTKIPAQVAAEGTPYTLSLSATSPENNSISFAIEPMPRGSTLSNPAQQKDGSWLSTLAWTPDQASLGSNNLTVTATDSYLNSSTGTLSSSSTTQLLNIQVFTPPALSNAAIKSVGISSASWTAASSTLTVKGTIAMNKGKKLPTGSQIQIGTGSQVALSQSTALVKPGSTGGWTATIKSLPAAQVPCLVTAQLMVNKAANNLPGLLAVTGAPASCIQ